MMDPKSPAFSKGLVDPAADAAAMLLRLGFAIFALVIPSATLMSRWVIVVLVPIGAVLLILAAILKGDPSRVLGQLGASLGNVPGLTAVLLALWAIASLLWAPNPATGAERLFKALGVVLLGTLAVQALPRKMRASNLHLLTIGVALGALLILAASLGEHFGITALRFPSATPGRAAILLSCLGWVGAAWLLIKDRRSLAVVLMALVFLAALFGPSGDAVLPIGIGFLVFAIAWVAPERAGTLLGALTGGVVLFAPLIVFLSGALSDLPPLKPGNILEKLALWRDLMLTDPVALLTGRGFEAAVLAREAGRIPSDAPVTLISDIWFDLGLIGALGLAIVAFGVFRAVGRFGLEVAPLALAGLASAFVYALVERGATQTWWLNGMVVFALVLMSVERGRYRTVRPRASVKKEAPDESTAGAAGSS